MGTSQQVTEGQLDQFHVAVADAFRDGLGIKLAVQPFDDCVDWKSALPSTEVFFTAKPATSEKMIEFLQDRSLAFGFNCPGALVPLWVSWGEKWVKAPAARNRRRPGPSLDLIGVSICFYAGNTAKQKTQILRAEWDNPSQRGANAAQPHWHIDPDLIDLPSWSPEQKLEAPESLEELPIAERSLVSIEPGFWGLQRLHLGMAGWTHHTDSPKCWQHKIELNAISEWLKRVLIYCRSELPRVIPVH